MSNYDPDLDGLDEQPPQNDRDRNIARLREKANKYDEAMKQVADLQRDLAVRDAGLTGLKPSQMKALTLSHEGELSADALRATAEELGFIAPAPEGAPAEEQQAGQRIDAASQGAQNVQPPTQPAQQIVSELTESLSEEEFWKKAQAAGVVQN
jgi:hypothetical protein